MLVVARILNLFWKLPKTFVGIIIFSVFVLEILYCRENQVTKVLIILLTICTPIIFFGVIMLLESKNIFCVAGVSEYLVEINKEGLCLNKKTYILPYKHRENVFFVEENENREVTIEWLISQKIFVIEVTYNLIPEKIILLYSKKVGDKQVFNFKDFYLNSLEKELKDSSKDPEKNIEEILSHMNIYLWDNYGIKISSTIKPRV